MYDPLTAGGQFALRSEPGQLMWVGRIPRPVALYGASVSTQTFEGVNRSLENSSFVEETDDADFTRDGEISRRRTMG